MSILLIISLHIAKSVYKVLSITAIPEEYKSFRESQSSITIPTIESTLPDLLASVVFHLRLRSDQVTV